MCVGRLRALCALVLCGAVLVGSVLASHAEAAPHPRFARMIAPYTGEISPGFEAWMASHFVKYKREFIKADGRVVDPENGGITHSESMGYGMLLAAAANDQETFDRIWIFVVLYMQREDGLVSWVWDPNTTPHVRDRNNATDGDILIATALYAASERWGERRYRAAGARIAEAIGEKLIVNYEGHHLLLPGEVGFATPRTAGWFWEGRKSLTVDSSPIINQSYWIFFAFPALEALAPDYPWNLVVGQGLEVIATNLTFPTEWSLIDPAKGTRPAPNRPSEFAYNAIRIPLYLLHGGLRISSFNSWLLTVWGEPGPGRPFTFNVPGYRRITNITDPGYKLIHALVDCTVTDRKIPSALFQFRPTTYYASSLHLLAFSAIYAYYPECVPA